MKITILKETKQWIVCMKPAGVAVETARVQEQDVLTFFKNERGISLFPVHRLDQPVEGLLVLAKTAREAERLGKQFREHSAKKRYLARVLPEKKNETVSKSIILTDYLKKDGKTNRSAIVPEGTALGKKAVLSYSVCKELPDGSLLLEVDLETGRHHQIRAQLSGHALPIIGDGKYGAPVYGKSGKLPLCLCAYHLEFVESDGQKVVFEVEPSWQTDGEML